MPRHCGLGRCGGALDSRPADKRELDTAIGLAPQLGLIVGNRSAFAIPHSRQRRDIHLTPLKCQQDRLGAGLAERAIALFRALRVSVAADLHPDPATAFKHLCQRFHHLGMDGRGIVGEEAHGGPDAPPCDPGQSALASPIDDDAAIGMQHLSCDIRSIVTREEQKTGRDFVGLTRTFHRCIAAKFRNCFFG